MWKFYRSKNGLQKDVPLKDIGLHSQNCVNYSRLNSQHDWGTYKIILDILHVEYERHSYELQKLWGK